MALNKENSMFERESWLTGRTEIETTFRGGGVVPVGGIIEWDDTYVNLPDGWTECDGSTINDPLSTYNGVATPNYNTEYLSISSKDMVPYIGAQAYTSNSAQDTVTVGDNVILLVPLYFPNGATITEIIFYGNDATEEYKVNRQMHAATSGAETIGTANLNTAVTAPAYNVIDNGTYRYYAYIGLLTDTDVYYGGKIKYTPRQKFIMRIR